MRQGLCGAFALVLCAAVACANTVPPKASNASAPATADSGALVSEGTLPTGRQIGDYALATSGAGSSRASGIDETLLFARNAGLHFDVGIGFTLESLTASAYPSDPAEPLRLGDPTAFRIVVHSGRVIMSADELAALLNRYSFAFEGAPLRRIRITTRDGQLGFAGQYYRDGWVDFTMHGALEVENPQTLKFVADEITVAGHPAAELLAAAHVELDDILDVSANGVVLSGNTIRLHVLDMFPPPAMQLSVRAAQVRDDGVVLDVDDGVDVPALEPTSDADSYVLVQGGDVKIMRTVVRGANLELLPIDAGMRLNLSLYQYRRQVVAGYFNFERSPREVFIARIPNLDTLGSTP
ncbi:hypothetical protein J7355_07950 [Endozoicomonas sp. G2_2]|uniref:hypothetical protein n=1 Tax=Endozoicomonas sp. G2_2 TaxID=2821092 RepID=UPI001ADD5D4E|nr:hypothetical protein [Endozoicomonas sp. G2_2]MBO9470029.1 hypothetical protein [Endozoicomonas sp. G2_2]